MFAIKFFILFCLLLTLSLFSIPFAIILWKNPVVIKVASSIFSHIARRIVGISIKIEGKENLPQKNTAVVYVLNHQSSLDSITYSALGLHNTVVIGKKEIIYVPIFGLFFYLTGNILLDRKKGRKSVSQLDAGVEAIKNKGLSISIFPEGTRNHETDDFLDFKKGGFQMAIKSGAPIIPIVFSSYRSIYNKEKRKFSGGTINIKIIPPVKTEGLEIKNSKELSIKVRNDMLAVFREISN